MRQSRWERVGRGVAAGWLVLAVGVLLQAISRTVGSGDGWGKVLRWAGVLRACALVSIAGAS